MEPITEAGWYRITAAEPVDEETAKSEIEAGRGKNLILFEPGARSYQASPDQAR